MFRIFQRAVGTGILVSVLAGTPLAAFSGMGPGAVDFDFGAADADGDGKLTQAEMSEFHDRHLREMDADGDGFVTADELQAQMIARMTARAPDMAAARIGAQDTDKDGRLSMAELQTRPRGAKMFGRIDSDGDGAISKDELAAAREKMADRRKGHGTHKGGFWPWGDEEGAETE